MHAEKSTNLEGMAGTGHCSSEGPGKQGGQQMRKTHGAEILELANQIFGREIRDSR